MDNPQELKKAILKTLAEKGDYTTILKHLSSEEKEKKESEGQDKLTKLITPISAFADLLTENTKGAFLEDVNAKVDAETKKAIKELTTAITEAKKSLESELRDLMDSTKSEAISDHLARYKEAEQTLTDKMMNLAVEVATAKANELFPKIASEARLTEDEIEEIIEASALSVESQINNIIGEYLAEHKISVDQITGFSEAVKKLLPEERQVTWESISNKPNIAQGGTNYNQVKQMIDTALASFSGGSLPSGGTTGQALLKQSNADGDADWATLPGGGDMLASVYDPQAIAGDAFDVDNHTDGTTNKVYTATEQTKLAGVAEGAEVNVNADWNAGSGDAQILNKPTLNAVATSGDYNDLSNKPDLSVYDNFDEYANLAAFPGTGETGIIYLAQDTGYLYRWNGSGYSQMSAELALGETSATAYRGDRGKTAYDHSQITSGNPHNTNKSDVGLGNVDNTSDANKPVSTAQQTALDGKKNNGANETANVDAASTTAPGKVELATSAEVTTGTDTERAITPAGLAAQKSLGNVYVTSTTSSATPTATGDRQRNALYLTAQAANFVIQVPSGTAALGNVALISIKCDSTLRTASVHADIEDPFAKMFDEIPANGQGRVLLEYDGTDWNVLEANVTT